MTKYSQIYIGYNSKFVAHYVKHFVSQLKLMLNRDLLLNIPIFSFKCELNTPNQPLYECLEAYCNKRMDVLIVEYNKNPLQNTLLIVIESGFGNVAIPFDIIKIGVKDSNYLSLPIKYYDSEPIYIEEKHLHILEKLEIDRRFLPDPCQSTWSNNINELYGYKKTFGELLHEEDNSFVEQYYVKKEDCLKKIFSNKHFRLLFSKKIQLIIFDLDDTLIYEKSKRTCSDTLKVLKYCKDKLIHMAVASFNENAKNIIEENNLIDNFIHVEYNHSGIWMTNKTSMIENIIEVYESTYGATFPHNILFVDDNKQNILNIKKLGVRCCHVDKKLGITIEKILVHMSTDVD